MSGDRLDPSGQLGSVESEGYSVGCPNNNQQRERARMNRLLAILLAGSNAVLALLIVTSGTRPIADAIHLSTRFDKDEAFLLGLLVAVFLAVLICGFLGLLVSIEQGIRSLEKLTREQNRLLRGDHSIEIEKQGFWKRLAS